MIRSVLSFSAALAMVLSLTGPALAQATDAAPATTPAEPVIAAGETYIRDTYTDWAIRCIRGTGDAAQDNCQLYQLLEDSAGNPVSEFTLLPAPPGSEVAALVTVITPLETVLTQGLVLSIDDTALPPKPFAWCNRTGCYSRFGVSDAELVQMKAGAVATVSIVALANPQSRLEVQASLRGFTAAFDGLLAEVLAAAPQ
jgi:invasion protein IalB